MPPTWPFLLHVHSLLKSLVQTLLASWWLTWKLNEEIIWIKKLFLWKIKKLFAENNLLTSPGIEPQTSFELVHEASTNPQDHDALTYNNNLSSIISRWNRGSIRIIKSNVNISAMKKFRLKGLVQTTAWGCPQDKGPPHDTTTTIKCILKLPGNGPFSECCIFQSAFGAAHSKCWSKS